MTVKIDPGAQGSTIPLSKYCLLLPKKLTKSKYPKGKVLLPPNHTWISHDGSPKPILGHFLAEVMHASELRSYPTCFYVFEDATSPHILLSYATLERLGIVSFKGPNLAATSKIDHVALASPSPNGQRKTDKRVTLQDPIQDTEETSRSSDPSPSSCSSKRKTASLKVKVGTSNIYIKGIQHKSPSNSNTAPKPILGSYQNNSLSPTPRSSCHQ